MKYTQEQIAAAERAGYLAYGTADYTNNPHPHGSVLGLAWLAGWRRANEDEEYEQSVLDEIDDEEVYS